jgi:hypothetical protein
MTGAVEKAQSGIKVGRIAGVGPGMGGSGINNDSAESLSEDGDVHKEVPVLEAVPVILLFDLIKGGDVNVLEQGSLTQTWSLISRSIKAEWPHIMNTAPIEFERDSAKERW